MLNAYARQIRQKHGRQMAAGADAERTIGQLAGIGLGGGDQLGRGLVGRVLANHQHVLRAADVDDGIEILDGIESGCRRERDIRRQRLAAHVQRVAIGRRVRGGRRADVARAAGPVVDDDALFPFFAELVGNDTGQRVDGATRAEGDDDANGVVGIGLGARWKGQSERRSREQCGGAQARAKRKHAVPPLL